MREFYNNNPDFKVYVDKYRRKHDVSVEEALTHEIVRQKYLHCREEANDDTSK
jgi:hypothetical protein